MTDMDSPLVSVIILSFNRKDQLGETLSRLAQQSYRHLETIVVENGSSDGTADMVRREFPEVLLLELPRNLGIAGWNHGMRRAAGDFFLVLDDDCYPAPDAIHEAVRGMLRHPEAGIGALRVFEGTERIDMTASLPDHSPTFYGCAAMFRKDVFRKLGGFEDFLFVYVHELEYSMRARASGFGLVYLKEALAYHRTDESAKPPWPVPRVRSRLRFDARNIPSILLLHFPLRRVIFRIPRVLCGRIVCGMRVHAAIPALLGTAAFLRAIPHLWRKRSLLPDHVQREYGYGGFAGGFFFDAGLYRQTRPRLLRKISSPRH